MYYIKSSSFWNASLSAEDLQTTREAIYCNQIQRQIFWTQELKWAYKTTLTMNKSSPNSLHERRLPQFHYIFMFLCRELRGSSLCTPSSLSKTVTGVFVEDTFITSVALGGCMSSVTTVALRCHYQHSEQHSARGKTLAKLRKRKKRAAKWKPLIVGLSEWWNNTSYFTFKMNMWHSVFATTEKYHSIKQNISRSIELNVFNLRTWLPQIGFLTEVNHLNDVL